MDKIDQTQAVMTALKAFYDKQERTVDFSFNVEIYAAKSNEFWLSPYHTTRTLSVSTYYGLQTTWITLMYFTKISGICWLLSIIARIGLNTSQMW